VPDKEQSVVPLNSVEEALSKFMALVPSMTDVRGEEVQFDLGSYAHLLRYEGRIQYIDWIKETLQNPEEIRRNFDRRFPFREIYVNRIYESPDDPHGTPFIVIVDRRVTLSFWTAFISDEGYLQKVQQGKVLWRPKS
jgi:hypothetical protein